MDNPFQSPESDADQIEHRQARTYAYSQVLNLLCRASYVVNLCGWALLQGLRRFGLLNGVTSFLILALFLVSALCSAFCIMKWDHIRYQGLMPHMIGGLVMNGVSLLLVFLAFIG